MKHIKSYNVEEELKKVGFYEISESDFEEYMEELEEMEETGEDCESEIEFGFVDWEGNLDLPLKGIYSIIKLGSFGEMIAYYGSSSFLVKYNGKFYSGGWNEYKYDVNEEDVNEEFEDYEGFDEFIDELKRQNIKHFFRGSF
jgi:hypothetical protein